MKLKQLLSAVLATLVVVTLFLLPMSAIAATENQSNQGMQRSAMLVAPDLKTKISVYPEPGTQKRRIGFGKSGDRVTVVEQVGSNDGYTWNRIQFEASPDSEGWVRGDFVALPDSPHSQTGGKQTSNYRQRDRYLGNQQQSFQQSNARGEQQQTQQHYRQQ